MYFLNTWRAGYKVDPLLQKNTGNDYDQNKETVRQSLCPTWFSSVSWVIVLNLHAGISADSDEARFSLSQNVSCFLVCFYFLFFRLGVQAMGSVVMVTTQQATGSRSLSACYTWFTHSTEKRQNRKMLQTYYGP